MSEDSAVPPLLDGPTMKDDVPQAQLSERVPIQSILGRADGGAGLAGKKFRIEGCVKKGGKTDYGKIAVLEVNDGSCPENLRVIVYKTEYQRLSDVVRTGTCVDLVGLLEEPQGLKLHEIELHVEEVISVETNGIYP